jgi:hypothetical protein
LSCELLFFIPVVELGFLGLRLFLGGRGFTLLLRGWLRIPLLSSFFSRVASVLRISSGVADFLFLWGGRALELALPWRGATPASPGL